MYRFLEVIETYEIHEGLPKSKEIIINNCDWIFIFTHGQLQLQSIRDLTKGNEWCNIRIPATVYF